MHRRRAPRQGPVHGVDAADQDVVRFACFITLWRPAPCRRCGKSGIDLDLGQQRLPDRAVLTRPNRRVVSSTLTLGKLFTTDVKPRARPCAPYGERALVMTILPLPPCGDSAWSPKRHESLSGARKLWTLMYRAAHQGVQVEHGMPASVIC